MTQAQQFANLTFAAMIGGGSIPHIQEEIDKLIESAKRVEIVKYGVTFVHLQFPDGSLC